MYFILILFFASLLGIIFMIGRKLVMIQSGQVQILSKEEIILKTPYLEGLKYVTVKKIKIVGNKSLVETIRFYVRSTNLLKNKYQEVKIKVKNIRGKKSNSEETDKQEISKFLKIISEYKRKIRKIKEKVRKEENL